MRRSAAVGDDDRRARSRTPGSAGILVELARRDGRQDSPRSKSSLASSGACCRSAGQRRVGCPSETVVDRAAAEARCHCARRPRTGVAGCGLACPDRARGPPPRGAGRPGERRPGDFLGGAGTYWEVRPVNPRSLTVHWMGWGDAIVLQARSNGGRWELDGTPKAVGFVEAVVRPATAGTVVETAAMARSRVEVTWQTGGWSARPAARDACSVSSRSRIGGGGERSPGTSRTPPPAPSSEDTPWSGSDTRGRHAGMHSHRGQDGDGRSRASKTTDPRPLPLAGLTVHRWALVPTALPRRTGRYHPRSRRGV